MTYFSEQLRKARQSAKMTQQELADKLGIARTNYIPFETGKKYPSEDVWPVLVSLLGVTMTDLKAWRIIDQYGKEVILAAFEAQFPPDSPDGQTIRKMLSS